jgi:DNA-binding XRE family transcriptional regulator
MPTEIDPTQSAQANYAVQLKRHREAAALTQPQLACKPAIMVSPKTISAVETMHRAPTLRLSTGLDTALRTTDLFQSLYASYVRESGLPPDFLEYTELEAAASQIKIYSQLVLTGLLQTEACARQVLGVGQRSDRLEESLTARLTRQEVLRRDPPPELTLLLDEAVIRKLLGADIDVVKGQLEYLLSCAQEPNIAVHVVPFTAMTYPEAAFTVLSFDNEPDVAYQEAAGGRGRTIEPGPQVTALAVLFDRVRSVALPAPDSERMLRSILEDL